MPDRAAFIETLPSAVEGDVQTGSSILDLHADDESPFRAHRPDAVFTPTSTEDAARAVRHCAEHRIPVTPFGVGSGQEGGAIPLNGGLSIDTSSLNRVLEVSTEDMTCLVEAGVTRLQLEAELRGKGLFFPVDPGADASIGGMISTGASGTLTPLYGSMKDNVLELEVVTAGGEIVRTGSAARKSSSGYNLTQLFVAAEGTLGLVTKVRLKLHPLPEARVAVRARFETVFDAVTAVTQLTASGVPLARAEFMDRVLMRGVSLMQKVPDEGCHLLCLEIHSDETTAPDRAELAKELCREAGGVAIRASWRTEEISEIWSVRHRAAEAERHLKPGADVIVTDVCVPISKLSTIIADATTELDRLGLTAPLSMHLADGNFHYALLVAPGDAHEAQDAQTFKTWLAQKAVDVGGTISGEHGIGIGKRALMDMAHGPALPLMRVIKQALDPDNIFNPGKVLPE
ncbi:MAG: FAD-binding oxidoreductase [Paracoccaceae bacterium]|nr:FAD-binding oxidoreductase [Paracoccaceae bacterium]